MAIKPRTPGGRGPDANRPSATTPVRPDTPNAAAEAIRQGLARNLAARGAAEGRDEGGGGPAMMPPPPDLPPYAAPSAPATRIESGAGIGPVTRAGSDTGRDTGPRDGFETARRFREMIDRDPGYLFHAEINQILAILEIDATEIVNDDGSQRSFHHLRAIKNALRNRLHDNWGFIVVMNDDRAVAGASREARSLRDELRAEIRAAQDTMRSENIELSEAEIARYTAKLSPPLTATPAASVERLPKGGKGVIIGASAALFLAAALAVVATKENCPGDQEAPTPPEPGEVTPAPPPPPQPGEVVPARPDPSIEKIRKLKEHWRKVEEVEAARKKKAVTEGGDGEKSEDKGLLKGAWDWTKDTVGGWFAGKPEGPDYTPFTIDKVSPLSVKAQAALDKIDAESWDTDPVSKNRVSKRILSQALPGPLVKGEIHGSPVVVKKQVLERAWHAARELEEDHSIKISIGPDCTFRVNQTQHDLGGKFPIVGSIVGSFHLVGGAIDIPMAGDNAGAANPQQAETIRRVFKAYGFSQGIIERLATKKDGKWQLPEADKVWRRGKRAWGDWRTSGPSRSSDEKIDEELMDYLEKRYGDATKALEESARGDRGHFQLSASDYEESEDEVKNRIAQRRAGQ